MLLMISERRSETPSREAGPLIAGEYGGGIPFELATCARGATLALAPA